MTAYRVASPYVTIRVPDVTGKAVMLGFHVNTVLPPGANVEDVERLLRKGMIVAVDESGPVVDEAAKAAYEAAEAEALKAVDDEAAAMVAAAEQESPPADPPAAPAKSAGKTTGKA